VSQDDNPYTNPSQIALYGVRVTLPGSKPV